MDDLTLQIAEELDAFNPRWREQYPNVRAAAKAAGIVDMFTRWLGTSAGTAYLESCGSLPDHVGAAKREAYAHTAPASLPFGYSNIGEVDSPWFDDRSFRPKEQE